MTSRHDARRSRRATSTSLCRRSGSSVMQVRVLAGADIADVFVRDPWCAAVHAYTSAADRATMERPCAQGAQEAENRVKSSLQLVSRAAAGGSL